MRSSCNLWQIEKYKYLSKSMNRTHIKMWSARPIKQTLIHFIWDGLWEVNKSGGDVVDDDDYDGDINYKPFIRMSVSRSFGVFFYLETFEYMYKRMDAYFCWEWENEKRDEHSAEKWESMRIENMCVCSECSCSQNINLNIQLEHVAYCNVVTIFTYILNFEHAQFFK